MYALVNSTSDPIIQLATVHTAEEISFLKRVLDAMFETYNTSRHEVMAITSMQAMRLHKPSDNDRRETQNGTETQGSAGQGLKMVEAEKMLKTLVDEGWFEKSRKGFYSLSPRALMELRGWLIETYNDVDEDDDEEEERTPRIKQCAACKEIVTMVRLPIYIGNEWLKGYRDNGAQRGLVRADFMIYARRTFSGCRDREIVRCARRNGLAITLLANGRLRRRVNREGEEVEEVLTPIHPELSATNRVILRTVMGGRSNMRLL